MGDVNEFIRRQLQQRRDSGGNGSADSDRVSEFIKGVVNGRDPGQQDSGEQQVSMRKQPKAQAVEGLSLPTISPEVQVEKGLVSGAAIQTAQDAASPGRQLGSSFSQVAAGGIEGLKPGAQTKRNAPLTAAQAENAYKRIGELETSLGTVGARLDGAYSDMQLKEQQIGLMEQRLQYLYGEYEKAPNEQNAQLCDMAYQQYQNMYREFVGSYQAYEAVYREFETGRLEYEDMLATYNDYVSLYVNEDGSYDYDALARSAQERYDEYLRSGQYRQNAGQSARQQMLSGALALPGMGTADSLIGTGNAALPEDARERELRTLRDYYREMADRSTDDTIMAADLQELESWSEEDRAALLTYVTNRNYEFYNGTTGQARAEAAALFEKYGAKKVEEIAESYARSENRRFADAMKSTTAVGTGGSLAGGLWHNLLSVAANTYGGLPALIGGIQSGTQSTGRYRTLDAYQPGNLPQIYGGTVRQTTAERIQGKEGENGVLGWAGSQFYQGAMSALDNLARKWVAGGIAGSGGNLKLANHSLMALNSFTSGVQEATEAGAAPLEAGVMGLMGAGIEILTEEVSLDRLLSNSGRKPESVKQALISALTQGGIEASEEELSFLLNLALEAGVMQERSGYRMRIGELMDGGMSYDEAKKTANDELVVEAAATMVSSFISGGLMDGGQSVGNAVAMRDPTNRWAGENFGEAAETREGAEAFQVAAADGGSAMAVQLNVPGNVSSVEGVRVTRKKAEVAGQLSEALGREIVFFQPENGGENGFYYDKDGRIYLANLSGRFAAQTVAHELTHSIEGTESWQALRGTVLQFYEQNGRDVQKLRQEIAQRYEKAGHALATQDDVDRELVAEFVEDNLLTNKKQILDVCRRNPSLGQRIHDWITKLLAKLGNSRAKETRFLSQMRDIYAKALRERSGSFTEQTEANGKNGVQLQQTAQNAPQPAEDAPGAEYPLDEPDPWDEDSFELRLEDEEVAGTAARYSYGGIYARGADMEALKQAKIMASQGVDPETIRQATGWFRGMEGKWRFEFSDDAMTYDRMGNVRGARDKQSAMEDLKEVRNDLFRDMPWEDRPKVIDWAREERNGNVQAAKELYDELLGKYGKAFHEYTEAIRYYWETENAPAGGFLPDYVSHPALFDHYPELNRVAVKFEPMRGGDRAVYRRSTNTIVLSDSLMDGEEETILHEIQHAIQEIEGFSMGSNPEFWEEFQKGASPLMSKGSEIQRLENQIRGILEQLPENVAAQFEQYRELDEAGDERVPALIDELSDGLYGDQFEEFFEALMDLGFAKQFNRPRSAFNLYHNTAGEIEARDTAQRRTLTEEGRKNTPPDLGGEETVFVEGALEAGENAQGQKNTTREGGEVQASYSLRDMEIKNESDGGPGTIDSPLDAGQEVKFSLRRDTEFSDNAIARNQQTGKVKPDVMQKAKAMRGRVADRMRQLQYDKRVALPEDVEGNTYIANSSYDGTEENTTVCPRSLAAEAFVDAVGEMLGRPLTVQEQIYISQDLQGRTLTPECLYCYVATDRKAYRAFLGNYVKQRDAVIQAYKDGDTDTSRAGKLYQTFLDGRKDTANMWKRFQMWIKAYESGKPMVQASHLTNINKLMGDISSEFGAELKDQIKDAMAYAQSASWAKKRIGYVAYNGHILKWKQDRINKLNSHYGLRMYSFSDFSPAFILENMQMITDAAVRGLKMLGYTKELDFVKIFAPTGMNINVSTFGFERNGVVGENAMIGAPWEEAKALRAKYPNVGITFVATNDALVDWALNQDWIDVVIPYHLVRTGTEVAKALNYTNYTAESSDTKDKGWQKGDQKSISPTEHDNDFDKYMAALKKNHLRPRFERFISHPNYMKLVNETRQPASKSMAVQPVFDETAINESLAKLSTDGYYRPIGGTVDRMYEIAAEVAEKAPAAAEKMGGKRFSLRAPVEQVGNLVAVHNLNITTLLKSLRLGGMPMPSVAVIRAGDPHPSYGNVSVVFNRSTVDPESDPRNRIYGTDVYTPTIGQALRSGLSPDASPEEYVKAMLSLGRRGVGQDKEVYSLMSYAAPEYSSIAQAKADIGRLDLAGFEEGVDAVLPAMERAAKVHDELAGADPQKRKKVFEAMASAAEQQKRGDGIGEVFREHGISISKEQQDDLDAAYRALAQMPTTFFEAKPERVVRPDEWALVVVPDNTDPEALEELRKAGLSVKTYQAYREESRVEAINSMPELRFSVSREEEVQGLSLPGAEEEAQTGQTGQESSTPMRDQLPAKARDYLGGAERKLLDRLQGVFSTPGGTKRMILKPLVQQISEEYLREGCVSEESLDRLFEEAWTRGVIVDTAYYDQYREVKEYLRTTGVTLGKRDQADIPDYADFKRRAFGTLRIVNDGLPVDSAYAELRTMAPELFPESITHPADQLRRMCEVAQGIRKSEMTLEEYYRGEEGDQAAAAIRRDSRAEMENAVAEVIGELRQVKRYANTVGGEAEEQPPMTVQEAMEVYTRLKEARRQYERVNAKTLLTPEDQEVLQKLLMGKLSPEAIDETFENRKNILAVYEVKAPYEELIRQIRQYKSQIRAKMRKTADTYLETALTWKDKAMGIAYSRETMERNIRDIVPDPALAKRIIREYFTPVHHSEAESNRFRAKYRDRVRGLELSRKVAKGNTVSEAHAVQLLGEAMDNIAYLQKAIGNPKHPQKSKRMATMRRDGKTLAEWQAVVTDLWEKNPNLDKNKIEGAVKEFRAIYDELFQRMNEVRVANGYEPVNYRQGYFPHFQPGDGDGILAAFGRAMGIDTQVAALPTTINGLTHTFKPGITWFGNAQERIGFNTAYDAVEGFDKYIEGVASVVFHTENIQKLRALATQVRYNASDEGIKKQVDAVWADTRLTDEEKQAMINEIYGKARYNLSNFVTELDEYTNLLANKKSKLDRTTEALIGRRWYTFMKNWENRVGANMIAGNVTSALTNFIPITQAAVRTGNLSMVKGMWDTLRAMKNDDGIAGLSDFLTNRRGNEPLVLKPVEKVSAAAGILMEMIDHFTSESVLRAAYYSGLKRGLSEAEAMEQADSFASGVMGDRSKGAMPTLFESTNPIFKLFTQFQLEVNNQWSEILKDIPTEVREQYPDSKGKQAAVLAGRLLLYFLGAMLFNDGYELLVGRRPALDPIGILNDTVGDLTGYELPNLWGMAGDLIAGEEVDFETEKIAVSDAIDNLKNNALGTLPFSSGLTLLGFDIDGGRLPAASAIPDLSVIKDALTSESWSDEKRLKEIQDELWKLSYIIPPFGGNQIQKIWKGLEVFFQGGSYTVNSAGEEMLQYPVFRDEDGMDWMTAVQAAMLGKSSLTEAQAWVENDFDSLGTKQTAAYRDLLDAGVDDRDAWALLRELSDAKETERLTVEEVKRQILRDSDISEEGKAIVYYGLLASDSERELMDDMAGAGADQSGLYDLILNWREANAQKGDDRKQTLYRVFANSGLTDHEKGVLAKHILGDDLLTEDGNPTAYADYLNATAAGLDPDGFMQLWAEGAEMDNYFELTDQGLRPEDAAALMLDLEGLEPAEGEERVQNVQRWRTCTDFSDDPAIQLAALRSEMQEAQYLKFELASDMGVDLAAYVGLYEIRAEYDANGNGSYSNAEVKAAIDALDGYSLTAEQKAILWQLMTGSSSAKNNPYSTTVGQRVVDARNAQKEG